MKKSLASFLCGMMMLCALSACGSSASRVASYDWNNLNYSAFACGSDGGTCKSSAVVEDDGVAGIGKGRK